MTLSLPRFLFPGLCAILLALATGCRTPPPPAIIWPLTNTHWKLVELNGGMVAENRLPSLSLDPAKGKVTGAAGVNTFTGGYTLQGEALSFGPLVATRMAGSEKQMKLENDFLQALGRVTTWKINGQWLILSAGETIVARFQATPAGSPF